MARKILLADDSVTAQNMGRKILADAGYEVITVNNGSAALKKITEHKPDVIVLDVYMPGYSGLEVCQRLKEVGETSRIPILLTVGKLEPFKQEEVKRVRADGFIVKPFEASELLSAISKLEDRIVPRSEPSKPGRFARATAALEEGRYDKTVAAEEDNGWKNRISFPSKKKEKEGKEAQVDSDDPAIYNPVNKDLRTVIEHKIADIPSNGKAEAKATEEAQEERVDLGALAPAGLPKDVTPEEIAALAAAAAQMQAKIEESKIADSKPAEPAAEPPVAIEVATQKTESKEEVSVASESKPEVAATSAAFVEEKSQEQAVANEELPAPAASLVEATAPQSLEEQPANGEGASSGKQSRSDASSADVAIDEPVTMAMAGIAQSSAASARWTAVSAALGPEETGISLEQEMQQVYAAVAASEASLRADEPVVRDAEPVAVSETAPVVETRLAEPVISESAATEPTTVAPAVAENVTEVASVATEAVNGVEQELEAAATVFVAPEEPAAFESLTASSELASAEPAPSESATAEPVGTPEPVVAAAECSAEPVPTVMESRVEAVPVERAEAGPEAAQTAEEASAAAMEESASEEPQSEELKVAPAIEDIAVVATSEIPPQESGTSTAADETATTTEPKAGVAGETIHKEKESDITATTAAAWASWHRIRESGNQDSAAKAVAAGAEDSPNDVPSEGSDPAIANIVDSVLADLRPKIVEEISRKLGKKK